MYNYNPYRFENLVNYDKSKTISNSGWNENGLRTL